MADQISRLREEKRGNRAAHSKLVPLGSRSLENCSIGVAESSRDTLVGVARVEIVQVGEIVAHYLHRHFARDFSRRVATHPIRDYEQPAVCVGRCVERVFITLSNPADISASRNGKVH